MFSHWSGKGAASYREITAKDGIYIMIKKFLIEKI
jgi:hypothetical protein